MLHPMIPLVINLCFIICFLSLYLGVGLWILLGFLKGFPLVYGYDNGGLTEGEWQRYTGGGSVTVSLSSLTNDPDIYPALVSSVVKM